MKIIEGQSLRAFNWWKVGGQAQYYCAPKTIEDLQQALIFAKDKNLKVNILSGGSNVLIKEGLIQGLCIHLHEFTGLEVEDSAQSIVLTCLAGTRKSDLAKVFLQKKLAPAVFLTGIPGDVGGGVVMNAGIGEQRQPREFCEIVSWIEVISTDPSTYGKIQRYQSEDLHWEYRHSKGWQPGVIARVGIECANKPDPNVMNEVRAANKKRVATQPLNQPSCGSVFRNPTGLKSAILIQDCGLKGLQIGGAQVSQKHANFIINAGGATADDIFALIQKVKARVQQEKAVELQQEVVLFGDWNLNS